MKLYGGIDLHSNNNVIALTDENDRMIYRKRLPNDVETVLAALAPYRDALSGLVVESTYNWYWLVDALMEAGYRVHLANTAAIVQYSGLKYSDDDTDAAWLAKLLRLGLLPEGYIYPKAERAVRDLLRRRQRLVQQHTANILAVQNLFSRNRGRSISANEVRRLTPESVAELVADPHLALAIQSTVLAMRGQQAAIELLEREAWRQTKATPTWRALQTVSGIGRILGLTIVLETGPIERFGHVGHYASYCRCVGSQHVSNGKQKGQGNTKNGNKYLAWAYVEAANFAVRYNPQIKRYYQRKRAKTKAVVATKAVAHKLARACYHILREGSEFDVNRAFA
ncbi:IS110 family transposase [Thioalkalicoccus limnaeus]|uniref:IS110 family transposase n=1 Tax=Thioalkalicoccus limnaeus TaxID=120681 RepID=A0ABV4BLV8_9GAMM